MIRVVFEDDYLLVIDKPAGLVVTSSETARGPSLEDILRERFNIAAERSGIVHRLDKDTSGLLLVAKTEKVLRVLQAQFKERQVKKEYLALVHGWMEKPSRIEAPIGRNPKEREKFTVFADFKGREMEGLNIREAVTECKSLKLLLMSLQVIEKIFAGFTKIQFRKLRVMGYQRFTLLRCFPLTGRTHQIRVHLKYINFPIVGDSKYGGRKVVRLDHRWCPRQFLHAAKLEFTHPVSGKRVSFESKLPQDLQQALDNLEQAKAEG